MEQRIEQRGFIVLIPFLFLAAVGFYASFLYIALVDFLSFEVMAIFRLKQPCHGYRDKQEIDTTVTQKVITVDMIGNIDD